MSSTTAGHSLVGMGVSLGLSTLLELSFTDMLGKAQISDPNKDFTEATEGGSTGVEDMRL